MSDPETTEWRFRYRTPGPATLCLPVGVARTMVSRKNIGSEPQKCEKCGSDKVYFVQHSHGNYPILDYVCPKCDLGGDQGVPEWYMNPTGHVDAAEDCRTRGSSITA